LKELHELNFKNDCWYSREHTWAKKVKNQVIIGISDYAQDQLGEIIFMQLPETGDAFEPESEFGFVESAKSVSELYIPLAGEMISINSSLEDKPEKINEAPFNEGWMIKIRPNDLKNIEQLMTADEYKKHIGLQE